MNSKTVKKKLDSVDVHIDGSSNILDLKNNPLTGINGFEITQIDIPTRFYNIPVQVEIETNLASSSIFPAGYYTKTTFAQRLQNALNENNNVNINGLFVVEYNEVSLKYTITNSTSFLLFKNNWHVCFKGFIGWDLTGQDSQQSVTTFTFPNPSPPCIPLNFKIFSNLTAFMLRDNVSIGQNTYGYIGMIPFNGFCPKGSNPYIFDKNTIVKIIELHIFDPNSGLEVSITDWNLTIKFYKL
jgi:hypothetical protein